MAVTGINGGGKRGRRERKREFGTKRQAEFLKAFASSCNIKASAAASGVSTSTVWFRRRDDAQFREAFEAAREHAVVNLESELIRRGLELLAAATPDEAAAAILPGMDAKFLLALVQLHKGNLGKAPGEAREWRSDPDAAAERLRALLARMRLERKKELEQKRRERAR